MSRLLVFSLRVASPIKWHCPAKVKSDGAGAVRVFKASNPCAGQQAPLLAHYQRIEEVEREIAVYNRLVQPFASEPQRPELLDLDAVLALTQPFAEWKFLSRDDRRALLQILCPEISVTCYEIKHLRLNVDPETNGRHKDSHSRMD